MKKLDKRFSYVILKLIQSTEELRKYMDSDSSDDYDNCYFTDFYKHTYH